MSKKNSSVPIRPLEAGILAYALFSLWNGLSRGDVMSLFWGGVILLGLVVLYFVRRKNWEKHWEEATRNG